METIAKSESAQHWLMVIDTAAQRARLDLTPEEALDIASRCDGLNGFGALPIIFAAFDALSPRYSQLG